MGGGPGANPEGSVAQEKKRCSLEGASRALALQEGRRVPDEHRFHTLKAGEGLGPGRRMRRGVGVEEVGATPVTQGPGEAPVWVRRLRAAADSFSLCQNVTPQNKQPPGWRWQDPTAGSRDINGSTQPAKVPTLGGCPHPFLLTAAPKALSSEPPRLAHRPLPGSRDVPGRRFGNGGLPTWKWLPEASLSPP